MALMALLLVSQHSAVHWTREEGCSQTEKLLPWREALPALLCPVAKSHFCISMQVREQKEGTVLWPASMTTAQMNQKEAP